LFSGRAADFEPAVGSLNISGRPNDSKSYQAISTSRANHLVIQYNKCVSFA